MTDTLGRMTRTFYDALGRVEARVTNWNPATLGAPDDCTLSLTNESVENICTLYGYDAAGRQITTTNALDQTSLTVYDEANRPIISVANWDGTPIDDEEDCAFPSARPDTNLCTVTYYDAQGRRSGIKDPLGKLTEYDYDDLGQLVTTTRFLDSVPVVTVNHYDILGNRVGQTDPLSHTTTYVYDELNRLTAMASPEGSVTTRGYDAAGRVITTTDGLGHAATTDYDTLGRCIATTDAEGHVTQYTYDGLGNQIAITDANGVRTSYRYDGLNRLVSVVENQRIGESANPYTNARTEYMYDALGNRVVITNALGYTSTHTTYDVLNRPVVAADALGHKTYTHYNALGYRTVVTDANGSVTRYNYDGLNRLISVQYPDSSVQYAYDALGNRVAMTDTLGVTRYAYDDLYRLVSVTDPFTGTVGYAYDLTGNRTQLTYPDGRIVTYTYDADIRLIQVEDWDGGLTSYAYDEAGRLTLATLPNGVRSTYDHDTANRLTQIAHKNVGDDLLARYAYILDGVGNRIQVTETISTPGQGLATTAITYTYDNLYRLSGADYSSGERFVYTYDAVGNMTALSATITNTVVTTKAYDAANRLITVTTGGAVRTLDWSSAGELLRDGDDTYQWDAAGRLVSATVDGVTSRYAYLGDGSRISMTVGSETTTYTLDLAASLVQVLVAHESIKPEPTIYLSRMGEEQSEGWLYYAADHHSIRQLVDCTGSVKLAQSYQPYGQVLQRKGTASSIYGFVGEQTDPTGLIYLRARMYAPTLMQFTRRDPWPGSATQPGSLNGFNYANANPLFYIDPSGRRSVCDGKGPYCGPNITEWFMEEIQEHVGYGRWIRQEKERIIGEATSLEEWTKYYLLYHPTFPLPLLHREYNLPEPLDQVIPHGLFGLTEIDLTPPPERPALIEGLFLFEFALYGLAVDYSEVKYDERLGTAGECDEGSCELASKHRVMTLCSRCIDASDLGNIMFGVGGHSRGYGAEVPFAGGLLFNISQEGLAQALSIPDPRGTAVGWLVTASNAYFNESTFCSLLGRGLDFLGYREAADETANCKACEHKPPWNWHSTPSSFYRVADWERTGEFNTLDWFRNFAQGFFD